MKRPYLGSRGYTLFEVVLAATIFVLLAGGVYFSVSTCVAAAGALGERQVEERKLGELGEFLRDGFLNLPTSAQFSLRGERTAKGISVRLFIDRAADAFSVGPSLQGGGVVLATEPDGKGTSRLVFTRVPERLGDAEREEDLRSATWISLLDEMDALRWRFFDGASGGFVEIWENPAAQPELVELTLDRGGQSQTYLFRVPHPTRAISAGTK